VLFEASLEVNAGEVVLLTGGNGSGKSTLLKCIYNILPCWTGDIFFEGERITGLNPYDLIRKGIVYIPQKDYYFENLTIEENLLISGNSISKNEIKERIAEVYKLTGLFKFRNRKPFNLSGGERKILAFGMGLIHKPKLFLFDEPFAGVDAKNTSTLLRLFKDSIINKKNAIIIVEHKNHNKFYNKIINLYLGKIS
jgi:branched-chain amino acid transport system ATP-binding protein